MLSQNLIKAAGIVLLALVVQISFAQNKVITGKVNDANANPLRGASVTAKGSRTGTQTDANGLFSLSVDRSVTTLVISSVGFTTQEVSISGAASVEVTMAINNTSLGEVVIIGYGTARRKDLTGSIATVSTKDFNKGPITSPEQLINGKVAGVQVTAPDGLPGSGGRIRVRGTSSLFASNDPLIIIDGVPMDQQGGIAGVANALGMINPNDIESFNILKDASATAIYGNRASNGVILITTKKGKAGKLRIAFSTLNSIGIPGDKVDVLNANEFKTVVTGKGNSSQQALLGNSNTDWQDMVYRNAFTTDNNIALTGGIKKLPYRVSFGFLNQDGILKRANMNRFSTGLNINPRLLHDMLKVDFNFRASFTNSFFANNGAIGGSAFFDPTQMVHRSDNRFHGYWEWLQNNQPDGLAPKNPIGQLNLLDNKGQAKRLITNLQLDYTLPFFRDLRAIINVGYDYGKGEGDIFIPDSVGMEYVRGGFKKHYDNTKKNKLLDAYLNYVKEFKSIRSRVDLTAGYGYQDFIRQSGNFPDLNVKGDTLKTEPFPYYAQNTLISFYGRANFSINNKYLFTGTFRRDGSSRFRPDLRWGNFPSAAFAWNMGEESFLRGSHCISTMKLRLGWGKTGQQELTGARNPEYPYIPNYELGNANAMYQFGNNYYQVNRPVGYDANIKWETTTTYNAGIDFGFSKGRFTGSIDYYFKKTENLLSFIDVPAGTNFTNRIYTNVGDMENRGIEFTLNSTLAKNADMQWDLGFNITYNKNKITKLTKVDDPTFIGQAVGGLDGAVGNTVQIHSVGYRPYSFFVLQQVYDNNGKPIEGLYVDRNGDGIINGLDYYRFKSPDPTFVVGVHSSVSYQRWNFSTVVRANIGNYMYNNVYSSHGVFQPSSQKFLSNVHRDFLTTGFATYQYWSDYYMENASFIRMDNITASYNFGKVFNKKANLRGSFSVQNVFVVTNYRGIDPEIASGIDRLDQFYPRSRVFSLGFNLDL